MPKKPEQFDSIMDDVRNIIMPGNFLQFCYCLHSPLGLLHWQHPRFHGYFASGFSYPDIIGEALISSLSVIPFAYVFITRIYVNSCVIAFSFPSRRLYIFTNPLHFRWIGAPAVAELELTMVNWLADAMDLPSGMRYMDEIGKSKGGGMMSYSSSQVIFESVMVSRTAKMRQLLPEEGPNRRERESEILHKLVAYTNIEAHSSIEKACRMAMIRLRPVKPETVSFVDFSFKLVCDAF